VVGQERVADPRHQGPGRGRGIAAGGRQGTGQEGFDLLGRPGRPPPGSRFARAAAGREVGRAGLAWRYRKYAPDIGTLAQLEAEARDAKRGLWSQPNPVPPWEWRKTKGEALPGELAGKFIGNRRSRVYHKPGCPNAASISPGNRMPFNAAGAAEAAGFRPGKDCLNR